MLFKQPVLKEIEAGRIELAFRRWSRPSVKEGGTLMTPVGVLAILVVEPIEAGEITEAEARAAGHPSRAQLLAGLEGRSGDLYRIRFRLEGPDPRLTLRERSDLSADERRELLRRLKRLNSASRSGPWTRETLEALATLEGVRAADVGEHLGREREWVKRNVRKLKNLGLTESLGTGYRVSPRGWAVLNVLRQGDSETV